MEMIRNILSGDLNNALGWTLLHSLWQSAVVLLTVMVVWRFIPAALSGVRYTVACAGLLLFFIGSVCTFASLNQTNPDLTPVPNTAIRVDGFYPAQDIAHTQNVFSSISAAIEIYMPLILATWIIGFMFSAVRMTAGIWYTNRLRAQAIPLENEWTHYISAIARKLGINRLVRLAESHSINSPMVIGYLKPVILVPAGMLTGLSTVQLETIFVHELAHIRRHDYLINFMQSFLETVFFFNPFVRILSGLIRKEREYCCDDLVITHHGGARAYANALTRLAEGTLSGQTFALSLASDQNQLLNRIRRIMERSAKNYQNKTRILLPVILLSGGLLCVSWLGVEQNKTPHANPMSEHDTLIRGNTNGVYHSRKSIITIDENGQPHEKVVEEFEGDSLPVIPFGDHRAWEEMAKAFEERFEEFALRSADLEKVMREFEEKFESEGWHSKFDSLTVPHDVLKNMLPLAVIPHFDTLPDFEESLEHLRRMEIESLEHLRKFQHRSNGYQDALREELVEDGYLSKGETIESLQWDNTMFKVNGKKIKDSELKKYQQIHDRYFNASDDVPGKVE